MKLLPTGVWEYQNDWMTCKTELNSKLHYGAPATIKSVSCGIMPCSQMFRPQKFWAAQKKRGGDHPAASDFLRRSSAK
jgi:hypothetical protein